MTLAAEITDGWPALFSEPQKIGQLYGGVLAGLRHRRHGQRHPRQRQPAALHTARQTLGFYIGGMGNFYLDMVTRMGV